jgi:hypothetical protein
VRIGVGYLTGRKNACLPRCRFVQRDDLFVDDDRRVGHVKEFLDAGKTQIIVCVCESAPDGGHLSKELKGPRRGRSISDY